MTILIRTAAEQDAEQCMALLQSLMDATGGVADEAAAQTFRQLLSADRGQVLVAEEGDLLLGMASVSYNLAMRYGGEYCQLEELIVAPEGRGKNIGGRLVEQTVANARLRGCGEYGLYLVESTEHNQPFYEKYGFVRVGSEMRQRL
jgi:GNAT superfamily N-acetyltransferase